MGLNGEVVSDINHLSLSYLPLYVTLDVKRSAESSDRGYKREGNKRGCEWSVIRITYAQSQREGSRKMRR